MQAGHVLEAADVGVRDREAHGDPGDRQRRAHGHGEHFVGDAIPDEGRAREAALPRPLHEAGLRAARRRLRHAGAGDHRAVVVEEHGHVGAGAARVIGERGIDRLEVAAGDGLLEGVVGREHVDGAAELRGAALAGLLEDPRARFERRAGTIGDVAIRGDEHGHHRAGLAQQNQGRGDRENLESQATHAAVPTERPPVRCHASSSGRRIT